MGSMAGFGILGIIGGIFLLVLFILWFCLPFMVNGINSRLSKIISQNDKIIGQLERLGPYSNK